MMEALVLWPYIVVHHLNPFYENVFWSPIGMNMTWLTSIPLPAIVMWPLTALFGPIVSYNVLSVVCPPLAAWGAFLLCRNLCESWWPSLMGGYIFGFSDYMWNEEGSGDRHLTLIFLVPLIALFTIRAIQKPGKFPASRFVCAMTAMLIAEFLISNEIFATMTMFGAITLFLGWWFTPSAASRRIIKATLAILSSYVIATAIFSPWIYWLFAFGWPHGEITPTAGEITGADPLGFIIPVSVNEIGLIVTRRILPWYWSVPWLHTYSAYVGLPSVAIVAAYAWKHWCEPAAKILVASLIVAVLFAMGSRLHFGGEMYFALPTGWMLSSLPLIALALRERFMMYVSLYVAVIIALWFASNRYSVRTNSGVAALLVLFTIPNFSFPWAAKDDSPPFITRGIYRDYLKRGENILILSLGNSGNCMLWQAEAGIYFRMIGAFTGYLHPGEFDEWPIAKAFYEAIYMPDAAEQLAAFIGHFQADAVVMADSDPNTSSWKALLSEFSKDSHSAGGVTIFRFSTAALAPYRDVTAVEMRRRAASKAIESLVMASNQWLSSGHSLAQLDPIKAIQSGLLKPAWCVGPNADIVSGRRSLFIDLPNRRFCGVEIGGTSAGNVMVGIPGDYPDLEAVSASFRTAAKKVSFNHPQISLLAGVHSSVDDQWSFLHMEFEPDQIAALAARSKASQQPSAKDNKLAVSGFK